ncbi:MAG: esterase [Pseudobutyrivibrio ruminis]|uniref:Esterase n=1 Tax=Pseudobutyrivibrio ruminis TaxID=46206 RepID=A0A927YNC0_9FIRM|nr:esterase [Pseudobutyrivibrio ruminis]
MKKVIAMILSGILGISLAACGSNEVNGTELKSVQIKSEIPQTGWTDAVPEIYRETATKHGSITKIEYESKDYVNDGASITKTAYVYTPYGYDENDTETRYDIIYLMHGWGGYAGEYFEYTKNLFDKLIENGDITPAIIVSPTFYNANSDTGFGGSVSEFRQFHLDFEENLMPAVEGRFHTYAASTSDEDLKASREHRIFGGFSLGSVTTWLEFCYDYDYIKYFIPMSGSSWYYGGYGDFQIERNVDFIEQLVKDNNLDDRGYFIYHAVGTNDAVKSQSIDMANEMLSRDIFTAEHYVFYQKDGGYHDFNAIEEYLYNALPIIFRKIHGTDEDTALDNYYTTETSISEVQNDPVFGDYGRLIFPVDSGYMGGSTLGNLSLAWYNYIDPEKTVEICNYMKTQFENGNNIFFDIYTDEEKNADSSKEDTGLFFFRGNVDGKFAVVNAGGGFAYVGAMHDSFPHALELSKMGYNAFALIYRPGAQTACEDLSRAIAFIHEHAKELQVDTNGYSLWGGSAGGRMADWVGTYGTKNFGEKAYPSPAAVIVNYTGLSEVTGYEPPTYSAVGTSDGIANWRTMKSRLEKMEASGIPVEFHSYEGMPHGFGLGTGTVAEGWIDDAVDFWERQID